MNDWEGWQEKVKDIRADGTKDDDDEDIYLYLNIFWYINIHGSHVTAYNFTNNNVVFFFLNYRSKNNNY